MGHGARDLADLTQHLLRVRDGARVYCRRLLLAREREGHNGETTAMIAAIWAPTLGHGRNGCSLQSA